MWTYKQENFTPEDIALNGNRFILANGYIGYRGTMEEFEAEQQVGLMLNGLYDQVDNKWREPVNAPNGLFTRISCDGIELVLQEIEALKHEQKLNIRHGIHHRKTIFSANKTKITISSERFVSHADIHLICMKYTINCNKNAKLQVNTGIDADVWDINGPHLREIDFVENKGLMTVQAITNELKCQLTGCEMIKFQDAKCSIKQTALKCMRQIDISAEAGKDYVLYKYYSIYTGLDTTETTVTAEKSCRNAMESGYELLKQENNSVWEEKWASIETKIEGDEEADFALRYSIYQLLILATGHSDKVSIPARGLSGQVYKGAVFWDTEMFMLPVFSLTMPEVARNLILYRYNTIEGAKRKAAEYGFKGAFYAWEGQETGDDACSLFNVTDVFTGRQMRTYFRDKQVHVSADIVLAIWNYYNQTGDVSIFKDGAAEIIIECARFFYSMVYFKPNKNRYEILDVVGPDEYHECINNNAFTNKMIFETMFCADKILSLLAEEQKYFYAELDAKLKFSAELVKWKDMCEKLYIPQPDKDSLIIEQFDNYHSLEDVTLEELKQRVLEPNEYLGGGNGLATSTKIIKQADVILMLNLFKQQYTKDIIRANWEYYEPRTEHGSSLSACAYSMTAAYIGKPDFAYELFMKTATIDLSGKSKQFIGPQYIGGTHPAANGGAWMSLISGFAGLTIDANKVSLNPCLPKKWTSISFNIRVHGNLYQINLSNKDVAIKCLSSGEAKTLFMFHDKKIRIIYLTKEYTQNDKSSNI